MELSDTFYQLKRETKEMLTGVEDSMEKELGTKRRPKIRQDLRKSERAHLYMCFIILCDNGKSYPFLLLFY